METFIKEMFDKISSYNLFNYLFPGIVFAMLASEFTQYSFIMDDIIIGLFFYYFIGLVISRFGSLIIETFLKWIKFIKFADYREFVAASKKDKKIEMLSEANNTYRTLCSLFILLLLLKVYEKIESIFLPLKEYGPFILIVLLMIMFLFSYRKQTDYVTKRIEANKD